MVEQAQSQFDGMLFTATPTQDLDAVTACQHLANQAFALMLRTLTALTNRAGSDEREGVPDEIALALNVSSGTGWSLQHLAVHACELPACSKPSRPTSSAIGCRPSNGRSPRRTWRSGPRVG